MAYNWRTMSASQRDQLLAMRQRSGQPWHGPPHGLERHWYHISAACYEHVQLIGSTPERLADFERRLLAALAAESEAVCAWCVLPNHYHALVQCRSTALCRRSLGKLHGATSCQWNREEGATGRQCWHRCLLKAVRGEAHRWATVNYIHHNPVHHRYTGMWQDWPFSSAAQYLSDLGREEATRVWAKFPVLDMGQTWDPPEL